MEDIRGSDFVVAALQHGVADAGFAQADTVYAAYRSAPTSDEVTQLRGIALSESANVYIFVRRDSPIRQMSDLRNRRIGAFVNTTHAIVYEQMILAAHGLEPPAATLVPLRGDEMLAGLRDGTIDAASFGGPGIVESVLEANKSMGLRLLELRGEPLSKLRARYPYFNPVIVTPKELPGQEGNVQTLGVDSLLVVRQNLPDERVYQLTRAYFEASRRVARTSPGARAIDPDLAAATPIPLHAGAARYYREREILQ
jgi:TRAP transporter TAXI family solute receptor